MTCCIPSTTFYNCVIFMRIVKSFFFRPFLSLPSHLHPPSIHFFFPLSFLPSSLLLCPPLLFLPRSAFLHRSDPTSSPFPFPLSLSPSCFPFTLPSFLLWLFSLPPSSIPFPLPRQASSLSGRSLKFLVYDVFLNRHHLLGHVMIPLEGGRVAATPTNRRFPVDAFLDSGGSGSGEAGDGYGGSGSGGGSGTGCGTEGGSGGVFEVFWADLISGNIAASSVGSEELRNCAKKVFILPIKTENISTSQKSHLHIAVT